MLDLSQDILGGGLILVDLHFDQIAYNRQFQRFTEFFSPDGRGEMPFQKVEELMSDPLFYEVQKKREPFIYPDMGYISIDLSGAGHVRSLGEDT